MEHKYEIIIEGHLDKKRTTWFDNMEISWLPEGCTRIYGTIIDRAQLHGIISKIRDLGLELILIKRDGGVYNE